jgi:hypothetical protein
MKAFIEKHNDGHWMSVNGFVSFSGFSKKGYEIAGLSMAELYAGKADIGSDDVVHGNVGFVQEALRSIGVETPEPLDFPKCLKPFFGRLVRKMTMSQFRESKQAQDFAVPSFVKPVKQKLFTGHAVKEFRDLIQSAGIDAETPVWAQNYIEFESEFRVMVLEDTIIGMRHYLGDPFLRPDKERVEEMVRLMKEHCLAAYCLDVGVGTDLTREWGTWLVEVNDSYACGAYGLDPLLYATMVEKRWKQMVKNS